MDKLEINQQKVELQTNWSCLKKMGVCFLPLFDPTRGWVSKTNLEQGSIKVQEPHPNHHQEAKPQSVASSVLQGLKWDQGLKGIDVLCTFKLNSENNKFVQVSLFALAPYPNYDQDTNPNREPLAYSKSLNQVWKWHWFSLHLKSIYWSQNLDQGSFKVQEPYGINDWVQTSDRNVQLPI